MASRNAKKSGGSGVKPSQGASGVNGRSAPAAAQALTPQARPRLGRLRQGGPAVRITKITSVCVARDSTNQPVRKRVGPASNTQSITANVAKSNTDDSGPVSS